MSANKQDLTNKEQHDLVIDMLKKNGSKILGHGIVPYGWQVPHLLSKSDLEKSNIPEDYRETFQGTVIYSVQLFHDNINKSIIDKYGIEHFPKPIWLIENPVEFFNQCLSSSIRLEEIESKIREIKSTLETIIENSSYQHRNNESEINAGIRQARIYNVNKIIEELITMVNDIK